MFEFIVGVWIAAALGFVLGFLFRGMIWRRDQVSREVEEG